MPDIVSDRPVSGAAIASSWGAEVHDAIEGVQSGAQVIACTAQVRQDFTLVFPRPYVSPPVVTVTAVGGQTNLAGMVSAPGPTSVVICVFKRDGTVLAAGNVTVNWIASGPLS